MLPYILFGSGFALAAAIQPGPLQAFLLSRVAERGVKATLPAALSPLLSDIPIAALILLVLTNLPTPVGRLLQAAGGLLLIYLAYAAFRQWRAWTDRQADNTGSAPHTLLQAVAVNILNPNPYLGWSLVLGPKAVNAWAEGPANAFALVGSFYGTMVAMLALSICLFGAARFLGARGRRTLALISAATLAALGLFQLLSSLS